MTIADAARANTGLQNSFVTSLATTLASNAVANEFIVCGISIDKNAGTPTVGETGWTVEGSANMTNNNGTMAIATRAAIGGGDTDDTCTWNWTGNHLAQSWIAVYTSDQGNVTFDRLTFLNVSPGSSASSITLPLSGTTSTNAAKYIPMALADSVGNMGTPTFDATLSTASTIPVISNVAMDLGPGEPSLVVGEGDITGGSDEQCVCNWDSGGDDLMGLSLILLEPAAAGGDLFVPPAGEGGLAGGHGLAGNGGGLTS